MAGKRLITLYDVRLYAPSFAFCSWGYVGLGRIASVLSLLRLSLKCSLLTNGEEATHHETHWTVFMR